LRYVCVVDWWMDDVLIQRVPMCLRHIELARLRLETAYHYRVVFQHLLIYKLYLIKYLRVSLLFKIIFFTSKVL
jgi:hypothetical protein